MWRLDAGRNVAFFEVEMQMMDPLTYEHDPDTWGLLTKHHVPVDVAVLTVPTGDLFEAWKAGDRFGYIEPPTCEPSG